MHAVASPRAGASLVDSLITAACRRNTHAQWARCVAPFAASISRAPSKHRRPISTTIRLAAEPATPSVVSSKPPPTSAPSTTPQRATPPPPSATAPPRSSSPSPLANETPDTSLRSLTEGFADSTPFVVEEDGSFHGLSTVAVSPEAAQILTAPVDADDVEIKPDGIVYLPEIKYRRILNRAFGPGGWGLAPRGETIITGKLVTREYGLMCNGRLMSIARGEQQYFDPDGIPTATEGCKSNALMRCCKDLGVASELWDPRYIRKFMAEHAREVMVEHVTTKKRRKHFMRKDVELKYPWKEVPMPGATPAPAGIRR